MKEHCLHVETKPNKQNKTFSQLADATMVLPCVSAVERT